jgi:hypothetical protein
MGPPLQYSNTPVNSSIPVTIPFGHMAASIEMELSWTLLIKDSDLRRSPCKQFPREAGWQFELNCPLSNSAQELSASVHSACPVGGDHRTGVRDEKSP